MALWERRALADWWDLNEERGRDGRSTHVAGSRKRRLVEKDSIHLHEPGSA